MTAKALSHITADTVKEALGGASLDLANGWDFKILAIEVREALSRTIPLKTYDPERVSNTEIREKFSQLSMKARALANEISTLHSLDHQHLSKTSFKIDGFANFIGFIFSQSNQYYRFQKTVPEVSFIADFLEAASHSVEEQSHKWRDHERKRLRIWRAETLIPIFCDAFGQAATVNKAPTIDHWQNPTKFMIFFQRMMGLAFGENATPNLVEVLETARNNLRGDVAIPGVEPIE